VDSAVSGSFAPFFFFATFAFVFFSTNDKCHNAKAQRKLGDAKKDVDIGCRLSAADWHFFSTNIVGREKRSGSRRFGFLCDFLFLCDLCVYVFSTNDKCHNAKAQRKLGDAKKDVDIGCRLSATDWHFFSTNIVGREKRSGSRRFGFLCDFLFLCDLCVYVFSTNDKCHNAKAQRKLGDAKKDVDIGCRLSATDWHFFSTNIVGREKRSGSRRFGFLCDFLFLCDLCVYVFSTNDKCHNAKAQRKLGDAKKGVDIGCRLSATDWHFFSANIVGRKSAAHSAGCEVKE